MGKLKIGIVVDEILRAKWLQFDRYYAQEFGEENISPDPYCYDFFKGYKWENTEETIKELREPDEMPDNINPIHYQTNEKGESDADSFLFKKSEKIKLTAKEVYNRFMYEDFLFEIHGSAPKMYQQVDLDINNFLLKYKDFADFIVLSVENHFSIPPTLFFLSKISGRFKKYVFVDKAIDMWKEVDVLITTDPEILKIGAPWGKKIIKLTRPYNKDIKSGLIEVLQVADLNGNEFFEKIIKYKNKEK